jgi:hypothetical protein
MNVHGEVKTYFLSPEELEKYRALKPSRDDLAVKKKTVLKTRKEAEEWRRKKRKTG